ncbi:unnamed protein product, partial [Choristocarpus tenellus]
MAELSKTNVVLVENQENPATKLKNELRKSCDLCCLRKRRCDGDGRKPCSLCRAKGTPCSYSKKERRGPKPKRRRESHLNELEGELGRTSPDNEAAYVMDGLSTSGEGGGETVLMVGQQRVSQGLIHSPRTGRTSDSMNFSPSGATGLIGLAENQYLNTYFAVWGSCMQVVMEDELRGAMIHVLSGGLLGPQVFRESVWSGSTVGDAGKGCDTALAVKGGGRKGEAEARLDAAVGCMWASIGMGALVSGFPVDVARPYAMRAREAMKGCYDHTSEDV